MNHSLEVLDFRNKPILKRLTTIQTRNLLVFMRTKVLQVQLLSGVSNLNR